MFFHFSFVVQAVIDLSIQVFEVSYTNEEMIFWLLSVLPKLFQLAKRAARDKIDDLVQFVINCHEHFKIDHYGLGINREFARCLHEMLIIEPTLSTRTDVNKTTKE